jgi:hypothetical protein
LSIENLKSTLNFSIYPNPNSGKFEIQAAEIQGRVDLKVYDLTGKVIVQNQYANFSKESIGLELEKGIYMVELRTAAGVWKQLIAVQ